MNLFTVIFLGLTLFSTGATASCNGLFDDSVSFDWPEKNETGRFRYLTEASNGHLQISLNLDRKRGAKDFTWKGPSTPQWVNSLPFETTLSGQTLRAHREDGKSALEVVTTVFLQLSIEQSQRVISYSPEYTTALESLKKIEALAKEGQKEEAISEFEKVIDALKILSEGNHQAPPEFKPFARSEEGQIDWPADGKPVHQKALLDLAASIYREFYEVHGKRGETPDVVDTILHRRLLAIYHLGAEQGRRIMAKRIIDAQIVQLSLKAMGTLLEDGKLNAMVLPDLLSNVIEPLQESRDGHHRLE